MKRAAYVMAAIVLASTVTAFGQAGGGGGGGGGRGGRGGGGNFGGGGQGQGGNFGGGGQGQGGNFGGGGQGQGGNFGGGQGGAFGGNANGQGNAIGGRGQGGQFGPGGAGAAFGISSNFYTSEYETMLTILLLTDAEKPKVKEKVDTMNQELTAFLAAQARSAANTTLAQAAINKIQDDYQQLANEHQLKIDSELTPEQKLTWEGYKLNRLLDPRLLTLSLTDIQKDTVKSLVDDTAKAIVAVTDAKDIETLEGRMFRKIVGDILQEQQAAKLLDSALNPPQARGGPGGLAANGQGGGANGANGVANANGNFGGQGGGPGNFGGPGGGGGGRGGRGGGGGGGAAFGQGGGGGGGPGGGGGGPGGGGGGRGGRGGRGGGGGGAPGAALP